MTRIIRIYDRYVIREVTRIFLIAVFGALVVMLGNHLFFELMNLIVDKRMALPVVLKIVILRIPPIAVVSFPLGVLFAIILVLSKMGMDREIDALQTHGMSLWRMMRPLLIFGVIMTSLTFLTNERIVPWTNHTSQNILRRYMMSKILTLVEEGVFFEGPGTREGDTRYYYIDKVDAAAGNLRGILVFEARQGKFPRIITARQGVWEKNIWRMFDGRIWDFDKKGYVKIQGKFDSMELNVEAGVERIIGADRQPQEMSSTEMRGEMARQNQLLEEKLAGYRQNAQNEEAEIRKSGVDVEPRVAEVKQRLRKTEELERKSFTKNPVWLTDYYFKFSIPVACLIFSLVAVPLSIGFRRTMPYAGVLYSVLVVAVYYIIMSVSRDLGQKGTFPPLFAAWSQNLIFLVAGGILMLKARK